MAIFILKGYAAGVPEIKRSQYEAAEEGNGNKLQRGFWQQQ
jgi:hypothetical protein